MRRVDRAFAPSQALIQISHHASVYIASIGEAIMVFGIHTRALLKASEDGDLEKARRAIENGANIEAKGEYGMTPLHIASANRRENIVWLLLEKGADVNAKENDGFTPLHEACQSGHEATVSLLLEKGANIHAISNIGSTPLHKASKYGYESIVSLLLEKGADPTITNDEGKTPLQIDQENNKQNCVAVLEEFARRQQQEEQRQREERQRLQREEEARLQRQRQQVASQIAKVFEELARRQQQEEEQKQREELRRQREKEELERRRKEEEEAAKMRLQEAEQKRREKEQAAALKKQQEEELRRQRETEVFERRRKKEEEAAKMRLQEAEQKQREKEQAAALKKQQAEELRRQRETEELERRRKEEEEAAKMRLQEAEQKQREKEQAAALKRQQEEELRRQRETEVLERRRKEEEELAKKKSQEAEQKQREKEQAAALKKQQEEELRRQPEKEELERQRREELAKKKREAEQKRLETEKKKAFAQKKQEAEQAAKREEQLKKQPEMEELKQLEKTYSSKFETRASLDRELKRLQDLVNDAKGSFDPALNAEAEIAFVEYQMILPLCQSPKYASVTDLGIKITSLEERIMKMQIGKERTKAAKELHELKQRLYCEQRDEASHDPNDRIAVGRAVLVQALVSSATTTEANQVPWEYIDYITSNFENVIASGGFGTIYRGTDMDANAEVAIKALRSDRMSARDKEDFEKEVLCLSELSHPNIVRLLAKSVSNTRVCMVLEYAAGGSVASILAAKSSRALFSPSIRLYTAECLVSAIEYLHSKGIFHRDVKPENMCMHEGWEQTPLMVLIDFGIAKQVPNNFASSTMTSNPGTELFMAPEYADKKVCHFDEKSEVYSIGAVMTCLITGSFSLLALRQAKYCTRQILFHQRDNIGGKWPDDVAMKFANIISQCNSVDPCKRPTVNNLLEAIKNIRALNGELGRLSPEAIDRVRTHVSRSQKSRLPESKSRSVCARCGLDRGNGITCPDFHLVCTESTCLENMARSQMGSSTFRCPGKDCRNEFLLADLYGHINPDLYNELLLAETSEENTAFLMNRISKLVDSLKEDFGGMVQQGFWEVKEEVRNSKNEILLSTSQWTAVQHDATLSQAAIEISIKQLQKSAEKLERKERSLEEDLRHWREQERNAAANQENVEQQLQEISTKLENLSLQNAMGVAYLASGRLQCPRLFILWPFRGPRQLRAQRLIYKEYRLFFLCEYDKSLVQTSVTIKHVRAWLRKVAPFLKFAIFSIRVLVTVYGVPIPQLPDFIPGTNGEEKLNEVVEHMEKLLSDTDSQALRSLNNFLEECSDCLNGDKLHALIREHESDIPEEAYGALATIAYKPKNRGWMSEMEIANRGSEYAWVKKANIEAFQSGTAVPRKFC